MNTCHISCSLSWHLYQNLQNVNSTMTFTALSSASN